MLLFITGALLRIAHVNDTKRRTPDEVVYTREARIVLDKGVRAGAETLPVKIGYLAVLAGVMKVTGIQDESAGAWLSCMASIASLALAAAIGFRYLPPWAAIYATLLMTFSLLDRVIARRCWQDALMEFAGLVLVWLACIITVNHRTWWAYAGLFVTAGATVVLKQVGVFVVAGVAVYVISLLIAKHAWRALGGFLAGGVMVALVTIGGFALLGKGGRLTEFWRIFYEERAKTPDAWAALYQSGPWYGMFHGLWLLTPLNVALVLLALLVTVLPARVLARFKLRMDGEERSLLRLFAWPSVLLFAAISTLPVAQNFRYLAAVFGPLYLLGGMGFAVMMYLIANHLRWAVYPAFALLGVGLLWSAAATHSLFERAYVRADVQDLAIEFVLRLPSLNID